MGLPPGECNPPFSLGPHVSAPTIGLPFRAGTAPGAGLYLQRAKRAGLDTLANSLVWREMVVLLRESAVEAREIAAEELEAAFAQ